MPAVLNYLQKQFPSEKIVIVGHSVGGHVIGMIPNKDLVSRALTVSSQSAYLLVIENT